MDEETLQRMRDETANPVDFDELDEYTDAAEEEEIDDETYPQDDAAQDFSSEPFSVGGEEEASAAAQDEDVENDDVATFTARFASGAVGTFSCSRVAWGLPNSLMVDVLGTKGRASWDLARCGEIKIDDVNSPAGLGGARRVLVNQDFPYFARGSSMAFGGVGLTQIEQFTYQAHAFLQQIAGVTGEGALPPCATFADGYREMLIADAVARSAANGGAEVDVSAL